MPVEAGNKLRAANLMWKADATALSDSESTAGDGSWEQWGTETIQIDDPGTQVAIMAWVAGHTFNNTDSDTRASCRVEISFDGGSTWSTQSGPRTRVGSSVGNQNTLTMFHTTSGTPSGDIVVRAQVNTQSSNSGLFRGYLMAMMLPLGG